jgi:hypothetical protein
MTGGQLQRQLLQGRQLPNSFQILGCNPIKEVFSKKRQIKS